MRAFADQGVFGRFVRDVGLSFASLAISQLVYFILRLFLGNYLGPADLGLYTLSYTCYSLGVLLSAFGIGGALVKYVAESKEDARRMGRLLFVGVVFSFLIGCLTWLVLHFSAPWIALQFFEMPELSGLLRIVAIALPFIALQRATLGFLNGLRRMTLFAFINIYQGFLTMVLTVVLVLLGYGLEGAVVALVLPIVLMSLFSLFATWRYLSRPGPGESGGMLWMLIKFGVPLVLGSSMYMLFENVDRIVLGYYRDEETVGIYAAAALLSVIVTLIPTSIMYVTGPTVASHWGRGETDRIQDLVNRTMKYTALIIVPISFAGVLLSRDILLLLFRGDWDYVSATVPLQILLVGVIFGGIYQSVGTALNMAGWVQVAFLLGAVQVAVNTVLCIVLIPHFGMNGASVSTASALAFGTLLSLYLVQRLIKIKIDWWWFVRFLTIGGGVIAGGYALGLVISPYICVVLGLAIMAFIIFKFFLAAEDWETIRRLVPLKRSHS